MFEGLDTRAGRLLANAALSRKCGAGRKEYVMDLEQERQAVQAAWDALARASVADRPAAEAAYWLLADAFSLAEDAAMRARWAKTAEERDSARQAEEAKKEAVEAAWRSTQSPADLKANADRLAEQAWLHQKIPGAQPHGGRSQRHEDDDR